MSSVGENNETHEYIVRSSKPRIEYPNISVAECIANAIEKRDPSLIALVNPTNGNTLTYGELHRQAQQFGAALVSAGVTKQDFVLFYAENCFQYVVALLGTIYLGLTYCSVQPACGPFEIAERTKDSNATVLVFGSEKAGTVETALNDSKYVDSMKQVKILVQLGLEAKQLNIQHSDKMVYSFQQMIGSDKGLLSSIPYFAFCDLANEHYFICYTSGTTGTPKGAIHTNKSIVAAFYSNSSPLLEVPNTKNEPAILWYPIGHLSGTYLSQNFLYTGEKIILFADSDLEPLLSAVERYKVTRLTLPGNHKTTFAHSDYHKKYDLSSLKVVITSSARTPAKLLLQIREKYRVITLDLLGATECVG